MSYDGRSVANYIIDRCEEKGRSISNLALQKIVYFCHAWCLVALKAPLVRHKFEAWEFGPVLPYLYREFREHERRPITARAKKLDPATGKLILVDYDFSPEVEGVLSEVVDFYSRVPPGELVNLSHARGGPWDVTWNHKGKSNPGMKISDDEIMQFYSVVKPPFTIQ